jgi:uncharacterized SAM-binding protein YcdF (DUF218 family)
VKRLKYLLVLVLAVIGWVVMAPHLADHLIVEKPLDQADAIIVLSGSAVYKERTRKAAELYEQDVAPLVFITNDGERAGWSQREQTNPPYIALEQRELIANGVMPDAIVVLPGVVSGTDQEAQAIKDELDRKQIKSLLIVTSAYHTRRALRTFEKILADKNVEIGIAHPPAGVTTPDPNYWWLSPSGWQMVAGEYVKSAVYCFYY